MDKVSSPFPTGNYSLRKVRGIKILVKSTIYAFAIVGILFILLLLAVIGLLRSEAVIEPLPEKAIVKLNLDSMVNEVRADNLLTEIQDENSAAFIDWLTMIDVMAKDERVAALAADVNVTEMGLGQINELHEAIEHFRQSGKKAYLFSTGMGAYGGGTKEFYLASAFDEITMQPNTDVGLTGLSVEVPFMRGLLDKIGIKPEFFGRYEYKNAMATFTDKEISPAYQENLQDMVTGLNDTILQGLKDARYKNLTLDDWQKLMNEAPFSAEFAREKGLIDNIAYRSEWEDKLKKKYDAEFYSFENYMNNFKWNEGKNYIALVNIEGTIDEGESNDTGLQLDKIVGTQTVLRQLREIEKNDNVKAVVLRINSPGGSYTAANEMWYALKHLKEVRKFPLIVSMGNYAASGGYFIALAGDKILADDMTITGSIGVFGGKVVFEELWNKIGVNWYGFQTSESGNVLSANHGFTKQQISIFNKSLDRVYEDFTSKVSMARKLDKKQIDKVARGRVLTGKKALQAGLVDEIGGLAQALQLAAEEAGIEQNNFGMIIYPQQKTLAEKIKEALSGSPLNVSAAVKIITDTKEKNKIAVMQRLRYDAVLPPMIFND